MNTYLILAKRWLEEVEGEEFTYDYRLFTVTYEDVNFLFDRAAGTMIASTMSSVQKFYDEYDNIKKTYEKIIKTKPYQRDLKKFNKYLDERKIRLLGV